MAAERRGARGARRRRDRFLQRQDYLIKVLTEAKLFPEKKEEQKELQKQDPLKLRAEALSRKLECFEIGRALFHINQRRGFKSNRKDRSEETTSGKVSRSVRELLEQMELIGPDISKEEYKTLPKEKNKEARQKEARERLGALSKLENNPSLTYGSFLWSRRQQGGSTRARPRVEDKLYDVYPQRELYKDEFNKIWQAQAQHHLGVMSDENRDHIFNVIFSQRPLKPQERGTCTYLSGEKRTFRAMPSFQRYRMYQDANNLEWVTSEGNQRLRDNREARDKIIDLLEKPTNKKSTVSFTSMATCIKKLGMAEEGVQFNLQTLKRKELKGNDTARQMRDEDCVGKQWDAWSLEKQDKFIEIIFEQVPDEKKPNKLREQTDEEVCQRLMEEFGLEKWRAEECIKAQLDDGTASLSLEAAKLLMEKMKNDCLNQYDAVQAVREENNQFQDPQPSPKDELLDNLPYYGEVFGKDGRHIIPGKLKSEDKGNDLKYYGGVTNPTVHIALNQIRQVINELISRYGKPASISIELARDLPVGAKGRKEIEKEQNENQEKNKKFNEKLKENGITLNRGNRLRLRLWEELGKSPHDRRCPFSGELICFTDLFENGRIEIEHLIPFSRSLDDSRANKVVCVRKANRDKKNRTPFEAFGDSRDGYDWGEIMKRVKSLPPAKQWRFRQDAMKIWNKDHDDFSERHLNDTRYIGRIAKEYLGYICPVNKIDVVTGRLTALLRRRWELDSILNDSSDKTTKIKNRDDHRHHAIDAVVIGMTSRSILQAVATAAERGENMHLESIFEKKKNGASVIRPWENFCDEVQQVINGINVSHRVSHKKQGLLHRKTAYGIANKRKVEELSENPKNEIAKGVDVVFRKSIDEFTTAGDIEKIRDKKLRDKFLQSFDEKGKEGVKELAKKETTGHHPIRHLRVMTNKTVQPICDKEKQVYKSYGLGNNWATEIYQIPSSGSWKGFVISMFEAAQKDFQPGVTKRPEPTAKLVMRLFNQDMLQITNENGEKRLMRVHKMSEDQICICEHQLANVAQRLKELRRMKLCYECSITRLRKFQAKKVYISPTGRIRFVK